MALKTADRVLETSTTQGTGTLNLGGATAGFRSFVSAIGNGNKTSYLITDNTNWEVGIGTVTSGSPNTLSRTTIRASSNSGAAVNWGPGTRNVFCAPLADTVLNTDENLNYTDFFGAGSGGANAHTLTLPKTPVAYSDGMMIAYRVGTTNTTAGVTVNVNSLGAKALKINGNDPGVGVLPAGALVVAFYKASSNAFDVITGGSLLLSGGNMTGAINEALTTLASAAAADIWTGQGNKISWTGTTTATGFAAAPQAGAERTLICAAAAPFTAGANMLIDGVASGSTYTTAPGDRVRVIALTTTQFRLQIIQANGSDAKLKALVDGYRAGTATPANTPIILDNIAVNRGNCYDPATGRFTCPRDGDYQVSAVAIAGGQGVFGLYKNGTFLRGCGVNVSYFSPALITVVCAAGDILDIRGSVSLNPNNTTPSITIREL